MDELRLFLHRTNKYEPVHNERYAQSWEWFKPYVLPGLRAFELGGNNEYDAQGNPIRGTSAFGRLISQWGRANLDEHPAFDLRYKFPLMSSTYDLLTCMEVMEHIKDQEEESIFDAANFTGSGIHNMLSEAYRIAKPGAYMFVSTPNVCGYKCLHQLLHGSHPYFYQPHNRELSIHDVHRYLGAAGWSIVHSGTVTVWNNHRLSEKELSQLQSFMRAMHLSLDHRGDCIFVIARKPLN